MDYMKYLAENAPTVAVAVAVVSAVLGLLFPFILKLFGLVIGDKSKLVGKEEIRPVAGNVDVIKDQLAAVEKRLGTVEFEVQNRATREEVHRLELSFTRLEGEFKSQGMTIQSIYNTVSRIDDFMYRAAEKTKA